MTEPVLRTVRRRTRPGCQRADVELIRGMFDEARRSPGDLSAELIPTEQPDGDYQVVQRFATAADLERWGASPQRALWLERLQPAAGGDPECRVLSGLDAWFAPTPVAVAGPPSAGA